MLEVITDIIKAEEEAKRIVGQANDEASRIRADIEHEEREAIDRARAEADRRYRERVADARSKAEEAYHEAIRRQADEHRQFNRTHQDHIGRAVGRIVETITTPAYRA